MKYKTVLLCFAFAGSLFRGFGQSKEVRHQISEVESNLHPPTTFVWKDSMPVAYELTDRMKHYNIPAVSIAVIENGKLLWARAYGKADIAENKPADVNTLFQAASISKSVNAMAVLKLADNHQLDLNKDIRSYLHTWTFPDNEFSTGKTITLKNLLSHTAGITVHGYGGYNRADKIPTINDILDGRFPANNDPIKPFMSPNQKHEYSGGGTLIIRKIIEDNVSDDYRKLVGNAVLQPLGMRRSTFYAPFESEEKNFASAYDKAGSAIDGKYHVYPEYAPDGLWTTASDLAKSIIDIQKALKGDKQALLSKEMAEQMITPVKENGGLGLYVRDFGGEKYFYHTGSNAGFSCVFIGGITNGRGVVILTNSDNGEPLYTEIMASISRVYGWNMFKAQEKTRYIPSATERKRVAGNYFVKERQSFVNIAIQNDELLYKSAEAGQEEKLLFQNPKTFFLSSNPGDSFTLHGELAIDSITTTTRGTYLTLVPENSQTSYYNPGVEWSYLRNPSLLGWRKKGFDSLKNFLVDSTHISGYMIIHKGRVAFSYGDIIENTYIASCRKSVLAMLMGKYVKSGQIDLNESLGEMGINDVNPLTSGEKEATVNDIISARSGVFLEASYGGDNYHEAPTRGSKKHGTYWLYSNWDFNVAGYIFEKGSGKNIYDEVESRLALPLQMQDFKRELQEKDPGNEEKSMYPAYPMWFSTRDMARLGQLMLNKGRWKDQQMIDSAWVREITTAKTDYTEVNKNISDFRTSVYKFGYGYMWWLWQNAEDERYENAFCAMGVMGQNISVFPSVGVVIVYKTKAVYERVNSLALRLKAIELGIGSLDINDKK